jgi:hypothetical protein
MFFDDLYWKALWCGFQPLTVGRDDNIFLNRLAQQAIQREIA